jgi:hypothetical protein
VTTATRLTLADVLTEHEIDPILYDAPTGKPIGDAAGEYEVLRTAEIGGATYLAVRGPSGQVDVADLSDGCRLHRDAISLADELLLWVRAEGV